ncbi:aminopeptidase [Massilia sp. P8910]|uniref:aminopeptidase n=1 Tax=Massilia antarctica TaxID=2765360 RepID=UPI0006BB7DB1|nr:MULTISPECIES: aminopeptidase [Massilia]MCE3603044.1 aminopeptidase [Massilia antarctica]MCY0915438.1 aminopeptidase [Massilia sp. H27-R4]
MKLSRRARNGLMVGTAALLLASCSSLNYYRQAAQGQLTLLSDARPIDDWLNDQATDAKLRVRLATARQIRTFAVKELGLPDNNSYKNYAALTRPFVLWNVVAAPELSLKPIQWCFPVAGCVSYRGYYSKDDAVDYARELRAEGNDVSVGGVPAYSTLGWFNDPLLSTFIHYPDAELARLIFHELSHQVVYVAGDSQFNESFASTVEEAGVERWLSGYGNETMRDNYLKISARKKQFLALLLGCRDALATNYASKISIAEKRAAKVRLFKQLQDDYQVLKASWGGYTGYDRFFAEPLSNAHLASIATYNDFIPAFRALLAREKTFPRFYAAAKALAELDREERHRRLKALAGA